MNFEIAKEIVLMAIELDLIKPIEELSACNEFASDIIDLFFVTYNDLCLSVTDSKTT